MQDSITEETLQVVADVSSVNLLMTWASGLA